MKNIICVAICSLLIVLQPMSAFAFNNDYLTDSKWQSSGNVTFDNISRSSVKGELSGIAGYYVDNANMSVYTNFVIEESSLSDDEKDIRVIYDIITPTEEYELSVVDGGFGEETGSEELKLFEVGNNFILKNNTYISAISYLGKEKACTVTVSLYVNGHSYKGLLGDIQMELPEKVQETKQPSSKTPKKDSSGSRASTKATTKFSPKGKYKAKSGGLRGGSAKSSKSDSTKAVTTAKTIQTKPAMSSPIDVAKGKITNTAAHMSKAARFELIAAAIVAAAAIALFAVAALKKGKKPRDDNKDIEKDNKSTE